MAKKGQSLKERRKRATTFMTEENSTQTVAATEEESERTKAISQQSMAAPEEKTVKIKIRSFDPKQNIGIEAWLNYFEKQSSYHKLTEDWKKNNIIHFLEDEAFTIIAKEEKEMPYEEIKEKLLMRFGKIESNCLKKFNDLKLESDGELNEYFFRKLELGKNAELPDKAVLEGLIEGTPEYLKTLIIVSRPESTKDYYATMQKVWDTQRTRREPINRRDEARFRQGANPPHPRVSQMRRKEGQGDRPNTPCRRCEDRGIPYALHWRTECPFQDGNRDKRTASRA